MFRVGLRRVSVLALVQNAIVVRAAATARRVPGVGGTRVYSAKTALEARGTLVLNGRAIAYSSSIVLVYR